MYDAQLAMDSNDPDRPARGLALYDWNADFDICKHPELLVKLIENFEMRPTSISFGLHNGKSRRSRIYPTTDLLKACSRFDDYKYNSICAPIERDYFNLRFGLGFSMYAKRRIYDAQMDANLWSVPQVLDQVRLISRYFTPVYGFSHVKPTFYVGTFSAGTGSSDVSWETRKRAHAMGEMLSEFGTRAHLSGGLHDIYELNVLSPAHLQKETLAGQTLAGWIKSGAHGQLIEISSKIHVWLVPDDIRPTIRQRFLSAGLLQVPV